MKREELISKLERLGLDLNPGDHYIAYNEAGKSPASNKQMVLLLYNTLGINLEYSIISWEPLYDGVCGVGIICDEWKDRAPLIAYFTADTLRTLGYKVKVKGNYNGITKKLIEEDESHIHISNKKGLDTMKHFIKDNVPDARAITMTFSRKHYSYFHVNYFDTTLDLSFSKEFMKAYPSFLSYIRMKCAVAFVGEDRGEDLPRLINKLSASYDIVVVN